MGEGRFDDCVDEGTRGCIDGSVGVSQGGILFRLRGARALGGLVVAESRAS